MLSRCFQTSTGLYVYTIMTYKIEHRSNELKSFSLGNCNKIVKNNKVTK